MNDRMGLRPWLAHTQMDYARMLLARPTRPDHERARDLLDRTFANYAERGMRTDSTILAAATQTPDLKLVG